MTDNESLAYTFDIPGVLRDEGDVPPFDRPATEKEIAKFQEEIKRIEANRRQGAATLHFVLD